MRKADAIAAFGTAAELARALGITRAAIHQWGDTVPLARQYQVERLTQGRLKAPDMAPYQGKTNAA
jgi:DNA-binding transcriptional regulator YdaS (Cro superfamily)